MLISAGCILSFPLDRSLFLNIEILFGKTILSLLTAVIITKIGFFYTETHSPPLKFYCFLISIFSMQKMRIFLFVCYSEISFLSLTNSWKNHGTFCLLRWKRWASPLMDLFVFLSAMGILYHKFDKIPFHSGL